MQLVGLFQLAVCPLAYCNIQDNTYLAKFKTKRASPSKTNRWHIMLVAEAHQLTEPLKSCKAPTATLGPSPGRRIRKITASSSHSTFSPDHPSTTFIKSVNQYISCLSSVCKTQFRDQSLSRVFSPPENRDCSQTNVLYLLSTTYGNRICKQKQLPERPQMLNISCKLPG